MKKTTTLLFVLTFTTLSAQISLSDAINTSNQIAKNSDDNDLNLEKRWIQTAEAEFILTNQIDYSYSDGSAGSDSQLANKPSFGTLYTINYPIIKKLSIGALAGYQYQTQQNISALKVGGLIRYFFKDYENVNIYLSLAQNISLSKNIETAMANVRIGSAFPVRRNDNYSITLNLFWDYNFYNMKQSVLNLNNEVPGNITARGYGISVGIQF